MALRPCIGRINSGLPVAAAEANGDPLLAFFVLAVYTECRPGELLALKWADVAWEAGSGRRVEGPVQWLLLAASGRSIAHTHLRGAAETFVRT